jgi:UDP-N-acetylglucosamine--N-acetylmuramyl-(pentapeptide) pyrophosphoryl-undecaprenol N-acetylglucosamine transferase
MRTIMNKQTIAFVAGRSGGHIIPALTLAQQIKTQDPAASIVFFTTAHPLDAAIIKKQGGSINKHVPLKLGNVPFFNIFKIVVFLCNFTRAFFKCLSILRQEKPHKVIGMGGYISIPVTLAARFLKIPVHLYDLDAKPGKATRFLAKYAQTIFVCFEQAKEYLPAHKVVITEYPIRFSAATKNTTADAACAQLGLTNKKTIFINGGSQGSVFVNNCIKEWLDFNPHIYSLIQIIHQTGSADTTNWQTFYKELDIPALVFAYTENIAPCYAAADVIICRAGAGSLFEAIFFQKPCLTIPLETSSTSHQKDNAYAISQKYPELITMLTEHAIKQDNMILFRALNKYIYATSSNHAPHKTDKPWYTHQNS